LGFGDALDTGDQEGEALDELDDPEALLAAADQVVASIGRCNIAQNLGYRADSASCVATRGLGLRIGLQQHADGFWVFTANWTAAAAFGTTAIAERYAPARHDRRTAAGAGPAEDNPKLPEGCIPSCRCAARSCSPPPYLPLDCRGTEGRGGGPVRR